MAPFLLLVGTTATTEEFFFRGHPPDALRRSYRFRADRAPPSWEACVNGLLGGLPLCLIYWRSRHNLLAAISRCTQAST